MFPLPLNLLVLRTTNSSELPIRETLLMRKFNPSLNANLSSFPLSLFLTVLCVIYESFLQITFQNVQSVFLSLHLWLSLLMKLGF